jgi:hypothetical protein
MAVLSLFFLHNFGRMRQKVRLMACHSERKRHFRHFVGCKVIQFICHSLLPENLQAAGGLNFDDTYWHS